MVHVTIKDEMGKRPEEREEQHQWKKRCEGIEAQWEGLVEDGRLPHKPYRQGPSCPFHVQVSGWFLSSLTFDITKIPPDMIQRVTLQETRANFFHRDGLYEIHARDVGIESDDVCKIHVVSDDEDGCLVQRTAMDAPTTELLRAAYKTFFEGFYPAGSRIGELVKPVSDWTRGTMVVTRGELPM